MSLSELKKILKSTQVNEDPSDLNAYGKDWSIYFPPSPCAIVFPESQEDVVKIVQWAKKYKTPLVPSGGRTGLSSAATASNKELVVSFDRMNKILDFNEPDGLLRVQPGVILQTVQEYAKDHGFYFPVDFGAKGSCQIGGAVSTNAGGVKVIRYGMMRSWVAGLRIVTGSGETLYLNKSLRKNATGYDLRHLVIGSEGTLGLITEVELQLASAPGPLHVLLLGIEDLSKTIEVYKTFNKQLVVTACEFFANNALDKVLAAHPTLSQPLDARYPYYLLIELEETSGDFSEKIESVFSTLLEEGIISDGTISQNSQQSEGFWALRERISESIAPFSPYKNDISVRSSQVAQFVNECSELISKKYPHFEVVWFGHIGDGNVHINILKPDSLDKQKFIEQCREVDVPLYELVARFQGAISAEHGVGMAKKSFLHFSRSPVEIEIMKKIKAAFDPDNIINPGKIF
ncbi:MAG: FAD-binding oxidoreductase [Bdellovibrionaceae bacterium]|nr:FAD-binding oxidoreductase [Pseudobdellovibrionaceae bacterium]